METTDGAGTIYGGTHLRSKGDVNAMVFGANSSTLWTTLGTQVQQWSIVSGELLSEFNLPCSSEANSLAPSPDGTLLAIACDSESLMIVDLKGNVQVIIPADGAEDLQWSGKVIAGSLDDVLIFWSAKSGKELNRLRIDYFSSWSGHEGNWVVAGALKERSTEKTPLNPSPSLIGLTTKAKLKWTASMGSTSGFAWSDDGTKLAVAMNGNSSLRDASTGEQISFLETDYGIDQVLMVKGGYWVTDGELAHRTDAALKELEAFPMEAYSLVGSPSGAWVMDPNGARPRLFSPDGTPHLADEGLAERAESIVGTKDLIAAFSDDEALIILPASGVHHRVPFAPDAAAVSLDGTYCSSPSKMGASK